MAKELIKISRQPRQASFHIKKGDEVIVISGTKRGQKGKVVKISAVSNRALVEGVNLIKKATRPSQENPQGGIKELEGSIHISNLKLVSAYEKSRAAKTKGA